MAGGLTERAMKKFILALLASIAMVSGAHAQSCNSQSGFVKSFGTFALGDQPIFGPDCEHIQDSGSPIPSPFTINVKLPPYNAKGDGVTDDFAAIQAADAAAAAAPTGACVYFPSSTYLVSATLNPVRSNLCWYGDSRYLSTIKLKTGSAFDTVVWFGPRTATTQILNNDVHDLGFNGNAGATNSVVQIRNITFSKFQNLLTFGGVNDGFRGDTSTTTINTVLVRNHYIGLESMNNGRRGFYWIGDKDGEYAEIFAHNNTGDGIYFGPANLNSSALCETTQAYGGHISSRDNGGDGIVFDEAEKYAFSSMQSSINGGYGIRFKSTFTGCTSTGSNSVNIATLVLRNDVQGAFRVSDAAYVYGAKFGTVWIRGDNSTIGTTAMQLDGVANTQFGSLEIEGWPGTPLLIQQGTPLGNLVQSKNIQFGSVTLMSNGNAGAGSNFGTNILNSSTNIMMNSLISANNQTSGGNFEINVSSASSAAIGIASVTASGGAANNVNVASGGVLAITSYNGALNSGATPANLGLGTVIASKGIGTLPTTVAVLPTCNAAYEGQRAYVTDQATAVSYRGAVTGSGATRQAVLCSNSVWIQD